MVDNGQGLNWTNERRCLGDLIPWPRNPRQIRQAEAERLNESFDEFGQVETLAIGPGDEIYNGHQRLNVLVAQHGPEYEVDVRVASRPLTEKEREKLTVYLHKGAAGEWDFDILANEFDVGELLDWGFEDWELGIDEDALNGDGIEPGDVTETEADRLQKEWGTKSGQLWYLGEHRLMIGDCRDSESVSRLLKGERPRYGFHDPPYGISVVDAGAAAIGGAKAFGSQTGTIGFHGVVETNRYAPVYGDDEPFDPSHLLTASDDLILWGANYYADKLPPRKGWLVWDKKGRDDWRDNFSDCELAWSSLPIVTKIFRHTWMGMVQEGERESRVHPTQKPVALIEKIMRELFKKDGIVIDFYAGSGPVLLAAERVGRQARVMEIMPQYGAVMLSRFLDATGIQPKLIQ